MKHDVRRKSKGAPAKILIAGMALAVGLIGLIGALQWTRAGEEPSPLANAADAVDPRAQRLEQVVAEQTFSILSSEDQQRIAQSGAQALQRLGGQALDDDAYPAVSGLVSRDLFDQLSDVHRRMLVTFANDRAAGRQRPQLCFAPDTAPEVVQAFSEALGMDGLRYQLNNRWSTTATDGGGLVQGQPTTLTYSFVPDGTFVPNLIGVTGNSNLFAFLDGIYGNTATWQAIYAGVFDRWGELCGNTYVLEPNDDGVQLNSNAGILGVRGDLRMAGIFIDGNSGTLAYNNFPNDGDMVIDTGDSFYTNLSGGSLRLRNVLAHEHGHGMGLLHVCPITQTKLMEPFATTSFDGPQHDDIRASQRHYGDPNENDNDAGSATDLGLLLVGSILDLGELPAPNVSFGATLSIDTNNEQDFFAFTVNQPAGISVTATPVGTNYDSSPQACGGSPGSCCSGSFINTISQQNLALEVRDSDGVTVLGSANDTGSGEVESLINVPLPAAGQYYVRVTGTGSSSQSQLYMLSLEIIPPPQIPLSIILSSGVPSELNPAEPTLIDVEILPNDEALVPGTETLHYRFDGGMFLTAPLTFLGGTSYLAALPASGCDDLPEFFISAEGTSNGFLTNPPAGAADPHSVVVATSSSLFVDDFEVANPGWTVSGSVTDGAWNRGVPVNCNRGDPPTDYDGSGSCWLTDNSAANGCNSDVDNGTTILTSPPFDMPQGGTISYAYWVNDVPNGAMDGVDALAVEIATDAAGTNWVQVRNYTTPAAEWRTDSIAIGLETGASSTIRIRFLASDVGTQNVVEAAVDFLQVNTSSCVDLVDCLFGPEIVPAPAPPATADECQDAYDMDEDGDVDLDDVKQFLAGE